MHIAPSLLRVILVTFFCGKLNVVAASAPSTTRALSPEQSQRLQLFQPSRLELRVDGNRRFHMELRELSVDHSVQDPRFPFRAYQLSVLLTEGEVVHYVWSTELLQDAGLRLFADMHPEAWHASFLASGEVIVVYKSGREVYAEVLDPNAYPARLLHKDEARLPIEPHELLWGPWTSRLRQDPQQASAELSFLGQEKATIKFRLMKKDGSYAWQRTSETLRPRP